MPLNSTIPGDGIANPGKINGPCGCGDDIEPAIKAGLPFARMFGCGNP
jgi:hypothetical protein